MVRSSAARYCDQPQDGEVLDKPALIRTVGLFLPATITWLLWLWRQPGQRRAAGALLACAWNFPALLLLNVLAFRFGWWRFEAQGGLLLGLPVDLYLGWILLWGAIPAFAMPSLDLGLTLSFLLILDLVWMPTPEPVVQLGERWLVGEFLGLLVCLLPAQSLARWTSDQSHLPARATLQVIAFSGLTLGVLPTIILQLTGGAWQALTQRSLWLNGIALQILAVPAILGLSAVQEFVQRGTGTPVPYDPPRKLVTSGVYAYLSNPMQTSLLLIFVGWGFLLESWWVSAAGLVGALYSAGFAAWSERGDMAQRFGEDWMDYARGVRPWIPRWRPWVAPKQTARLYLAESCLPCSQLAHWFQCRRPVGLALLAAEAHPSRDLNRLTYDPCDGSPVEEGLAALARGLEHLHFGWALGAWFLRLPVICHLVQLLVDAVGDDARQRPRRTKGAQSPRPKP